jgi:hypothetical protein
VGGYDVLQWLRLGFDGQFRYRLAGDKRLAGGRSWDAVAGPQLMASWDRFYLGAMAGPSTVDVASGTGGSAMMTAGGVSF